MNLGDPKDISSQATHLWKQFHLKLRSILGLLYLQTWEGLFFYLTWWPGIGTASPQHLRLDRHHSNLPMQGAGSKTVVNRGPCEAGEWEVMTSAMAEQVPKYRFSFFCHLSCILRSIALPWVPEPPIQQGASHGGDPPLPPSLLSCGTAATCQPAPVAFHDHLFSGDQRVPFICTTCHKTLFLLMTQTGG